jgi:hypothetical protein
MRLGPAIILASFFAAGSLQASGFHLYEFGGRASALGGAVVARACPRISFEQAFE